MNEEQLQELVENISLKYFQKPFRHQAMFNSRLRTTGGRYLLGSHNIEINKKYYDENGLGELIGIIKHELCHYHLHLENKGYRHGDSDFRMLLKEVGAPRFCNSLSSVVKKSLLYKCNQCGQEYRRRKRINTTKYVCGKCNGRLSFIK